MTHSMNMLSQSRLPRMRSFWFKRSTLTAHAVVVFQVSARVVRVFPLRVRQHSYDGRNKSRFGK